MFSHNTPQSAPCLLKQDFSWLLNGAQDAPAPESADEDILTFIDEDEESAPAKACHDPWVLLIVDDEPQVHEATALTLRRGRVADRPFRFLHAHSAAQAKELIMLEARIDLVLLDVMMETRDAGFRLINELRGPMARTDLKILIRSGQPGAEHEDSIIQRYAVEGYMQKNQQTHDLLMETINKILLDSPENPGAVS